MKCNVYRYGNEFKVIWLKYTGEARDGFSDKEHSNEEKLANNICRAKSRITEIALCNDWEWFVTLTIDGEKQNREDLDQYVKDFGVWVSHFNRKYHCHLKYILIPEQHKDGKSWHMHGLLHDVPDAALVRNEHGYMDIPYYRERFGYVSLSPVKNKSRCARYITKYVTKDIGKSSARLADLGKHLYYASRGLAGRVECGTYDIPVTDDAYIGDYSFTLWCDASRGGLCDRYGEIVVDFKELEHNTNINIKDNNVTPSHGEKQHELTF